jgi:uncharacterized Zn finger protein (UPF0148 family)
MALGFYIKKLILTGTGKKTAQIEFLTGLNVVAGASDTGKTFIFQCIDFMMGAQTPPKQIEESKGYEKVFLIIGTYSGTVYSLQRNITGGAFQIKQGNEESTAPFEEYGEKLANDSKNISTFLMTLCGLDDVLLKKNANNQKARLSFRDIAGLCLVDESTIITENSPVYHSRESTARTKEQSLFFYFLTGEDAASLVETEDPKLLKSRIAGKIELIKEFIERTQKKLNEFKGLQVEQLEKDLDVQYERLNLEYRTSLSEIDKLRNQRSKLFENIAKLESKILFNKELLARFELLEKHYTSDQKRLEFIAEGSFLFNQLNSVSCPICGTEMKESHKEHLEKFEQENGEFELSLQRELEKITLKQSELSETVSLLRDDVIKQKKSLEKVREKLTEIDDSLSNSLTPVTQSLRTRLIIITEEKANLERYRALKSEFDAYNQQLNDLNAVGTKKVQNNEEAIAAQKQLYLEFCQIVEGILNDWHYPNLTTIAFNNSSKVFDLVLNNNPRGASGKGYRAITYSAFVYGLLKYCQRKNHNHPNFLVLDSPLTTFKARDGRPDNSDEISEDIEFAFFKNLATTNDESQIIVLENKEPNQALMEGMHYIHFSGQKGIGRAGFFE